MSENSFYFRKGPLNRDWLNVALHYQGGIASLQRNGKPLEKLFYFLRIVFAPSPGTLSPNVLQALDGVAVPAAKSLDDQRYEGDALRATMVEMGAIFRGFPHLNGSCRKISGAVDDGVLCRGDDADIKREFLAVDPRGNKDVGWA